jgi:hypothetical protein
MYLPRQNETILPVVCVLPWRRWEDKIKKDLREVGCGDMDLIAMAQDRDRWRALVNAEMNLRAP